MDSCGEYFLFYGLTDFMLFLVLAWRYGFFFLSRILSAFFTRSLGMRLASSHDDLIFKNWFSYSRFPLTEGGGYFRFGILANHLASMFFLPLSGDPVRSRSTDSLTHIFSSFNGQPKLTYILYLSFNGQSLANSNTEGSGNSLFLFSQWEITWHEGSLFNNYYTEA